MTIPSPEDGRDVPAGWRRQAAAVWRLLRVPLVAALNLLLALILIFEEWGWRPLAAAIAWLARFRVVARLEALVAALPPYAALFVFAAPSLILFPVKLGALWLLAAGKVLYAGLLLAAAKVVSTALVARIFMLTRPALMRIGWFRRLYDVFIPWKDALFARIRASWTWRYGRMVKSRLKQMGRRAWTALAPQRAAIRQFVTRLLRGQGASDPPSSRPDPE
ncbi:MAG: hypothetical protein AB7E80_05145 [Hyphomicrobiaceae bacterium]